jgi:hypothetical protein
MVAGRRNLRESLQRSAVGPAIRSCFSRAEEISWRLRGQPVPAPPHRKREVLAQYAERLRPTAFVETGTFRGDTVARMAHHVPLVISIELDASLYEAARRRFSGNERVRLLQGDSAALLGSVVHALEGPALFWLDGHYSGGPTARGAHATPILSELEAVLDDERPHALLIDDARLFDGTDGYPSLSDVEARCRELRPKTSWSVADDIIRVLPPPT